MPSEREERLIQWFAAKVRDAERNSSAHKKKAPPAGPQDTGPSSWDSMPVALATFPCGAGTVRGLGATRNVAKGETLMRIPYDCFLTAEAVLTQLCPQLETDVRTIEQRLEASGSPNSITAALQKASTLLYSCEHVLVLFLLLQRSGHLSSAMTTYIDALPPLMAMTTPEMLFLLEYADCPEAYLRNDAALSAYRVEHRVALYSKEALVILLGSKVRFQKLCRRVERLYLRYQALHSTYLSVPTGNDAVWLQTVGADAPFSLWLWACHMVNSRSFMYRPPRWSSYPKRYEDGYASSDDGSASSSDGEASDDDAMLRAVEAAKEHHRNERRSAQQPQGTSEQTAAVLRHAAAVQHDEVATRNQRIGGWHGGDAPGGGHDRNHGPGSSRSSSSDESSCSDDDDDDALLLAMVPFADMFNHCPTSGTTNFTFDKESSALHIKSDRPILAGEQVYLKYNAMDHWRFAKYYGFVPNASNIGGDGVASGPGPTDAFPIAVPVPPSLTSSSAASSILAVTKSQLFEGRALKRHCYVTSKGPNQQLLSVLRLAFLGAEDLSRYTAAYERDPLSMRNEWHVYEYLKNELSMRKLEIERNVKKASQSPPPSTSGPTFPTSGLTCRGLSMVAVRERDLQVVHHALRTCKKRFEDLCGLVYFGTSTTQILRTNVIQEQFRQLKGMGRLPLSSEEQQKAGLGLLPPLVAGANYSVPEYVDRLFDKLSGRFAKPAAVAYVDASVSRGPGQL